MQKHPGLARRLITLALALGPATHVLAAPLSAEQVAARRQLIEGAQAARAAGEPARALELGLRAGELEMSVSLRRFIAELQLEVGDAAASLGSAELCERDARASGAADHADACGAVATTARERVGFVVIRVEPDVADARVELVGREVPRVLWGQRYVVNPGVAVVTATAPGHAPARAEGEVALGQAIELVLALTPQGPPEAPPPPREPASYELSLLVPIGAGVAVAGAVVALGVGLSGVTALADYEDRCTVADASPACVAEQAALQEDLDLRAIGVNVALGTAAVGLVLGTVGLLLSGTPDDVDASLWQGKVRF